MIVIAGNEPFTQGTTHFSESIHNAVDAGIIVNTIFCGPHDQGINTEWQAGATLGNGRYTSIDQNRSVTEIPTPFDDKIVMLNSKLNETYYYYGEKGKASLQRLYTQDQENENIGVDALSNRAVSKSSALYNNATWDLVDAYTEGKIEIENLERKDLPEELKNMPVKELEAFIQAAIEKRTQVKKEITEANAKRAKFLSDNQKSNPSTKALDDALVEMLIEQCQAIGFTFEEPEPQEIETQN